MLASSSKRASSSTTTVTSLPRRARLDQRFHQHRVDAGAVDRLLDRDDVRIVDGLADELDDRLERLERMVQQDVVLADRRENVGRVAQPIGKARTNGRYSSASIDTASIER